MIVIKCVEKDGIVYPEAPIPENAVMVVGDGKTNTFTVYFQGDELPKQK